MLSKSKVLFAGVLMILLAVSSCSSRLSIEQMEPERGTAVVHGNILSFEEKSGNYNVSLSVIDSKSVQGAKSYYKNKEYTFVATKNFVKIYKEKNNVELSKKLSESKEVLIKVKQNTVTSNTDIIIIKF